MGFGVCLFGRNPQISPFFWRVENLLLFSTWKKFCFGLVGELLVGGKIVSPASENHGKRHSPFPRGLGGCGTLNPPRGLGFRVFG